MLVILTSESLARDRHNIYNNIDYLVPETNV